VESCIELLKELILVQSVDQNGANTLIDYCKKWLTERGLTCHIIENAGYKSLITTIGSGPKTLILNGHLDVVNGSHHQFSPHVIDDNLYGRGAADMKAGVAAIMSIMVELQNVALSSQVQLQLVTDEETGGNNGSRYLAENGYRGDFVICAEPTQLGLGIQAKGILQLDIEVRGKSAHGSRPWEGENAILKAHDIFQQITQLPFCTKKSPLYDSPSINLAKIAAGDVYNKVPDYCLMSLDIRFLPTQDEHEIIEQIKTVAKHINVHAIGCPVTTLPDNPYVQQLAMMTEEQTACPSKIFGQHGSADTRYFSKYQIPAIEFGPSGANWHGDEEYVEIPSIQKYMAILKQFIAHFS